MTVNSTLSDFAQLSLWLFFIFLSYYNVYVAM